MTNTTRHPSHIPTIVSSLSNSSTLYPTSQPTRLPSALPSAHNSQSNNQSAALNFLIGVVLFIVFFGVCACLVSIYKMISVPRSRYRVAPSLAYATNIDALVIDNELDSNIVYTHAAIINNQANATGSHEHPLSNDVPIAHAIPIQTIRLSQL